MYLSLRDRPAPARAAAAPTRRRFGVAGTVVGLGVVSLVTDVSSESVNAVLPLYLTSVLGLSTLAYGVVDGLYQGVGALVRLLGGWLADRTEHPKRVALVGYAASAVTRVLLVPAHSFAAVSGVITLDRTAKGLRTAPRDSMIAAASGPGELGRAFGVHRALDTTGALLGPLLAFWILSVVPGDYSSVFVASTAFAVIGVAVLVLLVPGRRRVPRTTPGSADAAAPHADARTRQRVPLRTFATRRWARLLAAAALLGVLTVSDGFLYLEVSTRDSLAARYFPLLYVGTSVSYLLLAVPVGRWADRVGRARVFLAGHVVLLAAYACAGGPAGGAVLSVACLLLLGGYYAATDGVLAALAGELAPAAARGTGIAAAQTVVAVARFAASLGFALLWTRVGRQQALVDVGIALAAALPVAAVLLRGTGARHVHAEVPA